jgi:tRNA dimethylallyltransferase
MRIRALIGPTASGKESTALAVASASPAEILSLDSMKVYRGMSVGTAKPDAEARSRVPHHLVDIADPREAFSTRNWLAAAEEALADIEARGPAPLFSGGTALYLKALLFGLFEGPSADPGIRARLEAETGENLHRRLDEVDPATAAKVHENDRRRLIRALEVYEITGRPISELRREWEVDSPPRPALLAGIRRDREDLYHRIDLRVDRMVEAGLVEEVRGLLEEERLGPVARQALGYKEIADHLEGTVETLSEALVLLKRRTRLFARRQITWFKHFEVHWVDVRPGDDPDSVAESVRKILFDRA